MVKQSRFETCPNPFPSRPYTPTYSQIRPSYSLADPDSKYGQHLKMFTTNEIRRCRIMSKKRMIMLKIFLILLNQNLDVFEE